MASKDKGDEMSSNCSDSDDSPEDDMDMENYYYNEPENLELQQIKEDDPEEFDYKLLQIEEVEKLQNENVEKLSDALKITPAQAKLLIHTQKWQIDEIIARHKDNPHQLFKDAQIFPTKNTSSHQDSAGGHGMYCSICFGVVPRDCLVGLQCNHNFCKECWKKFFEIQINAGLSTGIECMAKDCDILVSDNFLTSIVTSPRLREKYQQFMFRDLVKSHPELRFCPGAGCCMIVQAKEPKAKRVVCTCGTVFCFLCSLEYHAPTECDTVKRWLTKCADDSETANYISAHTKDCPKCNVCIEKNGGCNHMQCSKCKHDWCWVCLGDWKTHGSEYYDCSRYKENPNVVFESTQAQAREALKKYLFYFERWENHAKSLRLEEQTREKIRSRINDKVMKNNGTWIDWQHLLVAAGLLHKCRYTLQYTYPYAYYDTSSRKQWFEGEQAQLEVAVENLSWMVEHAEIADRGELERKMAVVEKRRRNILRSDPVVG